MNVTKCGRDPCESKYKEPVAGYWKKGEIMPQLLPRCHSCYEAHRVAAASNGYAWSPIVTHPCNCPMQIVMTKGCTCGGV